MNEGISIEPANTSDAASVVALLTQVGLPTHGVEEQIENFLVAREGEEVIGCVGMEVYGESCLLRSLAVHPDHQGRGLGVRLTKQIIDRARERGMKQAVILTHTVQRLATKFGFGELSRESVDPRLAQSWEFQSTGCQQAVCMRLNLGQGSATVGENHVLS